MSAEKKFVMTYNGIRKLEEELNFLKTTKRSEIKEKIKVALSFGDLSENSEYDEAKNEQAFVEGKIAQLEAMLKKVEVVDESDISKDSVSIGSRVKVKDLDFNEIDLYTKVDLNNKENSEKSNSKKETKNKVCQCHNQNTN